jgi:hypothetical protein
MRIVRKDPRWVHLRTCQTCGVTLCCDTTNGSGAGVGCARRRSSSVRCASVSSRPAAAFSHRMRCRSTTHSMAEAGDGDSNSQGCRPPQASSTEWSAMSEFVPTSRPGRIEASALAALPVKQHQVRFPIGRSRQTGASACIRGSARNSCVWTVTSRSIHDVTPLTQKRMQQATSAHRRLHTSHLPT